MNVKPTGLGKLALLFKQEGYFVIKEHNTKNLVGVYSFEVKYVSYLLLILSMNNNIVYFYFSFVLTYLLFINHLYINCTYFKKYH